MKAQSPRHRRTLLLFGLALVACGVARAQASNSQTQNPAGGSRTSARPTAQSGAPAASRPVKLDVIAVKLDVIVTDESNRFVADLRQEDFRVEEDGATQAITSFAREESLPLSYSLLVDNTGSLRAMFDHMLGAGGTIIAGKSARDEMSVMRFVSRDRIKSMQDFTRDRNALVDALDRMYIEGGWTALIDALSVAAEAVVARAPGEERRRALVVLTDGGERDSGAKLEEVLKYLRRHNVAIYVFGLTEAADAGAFDRVKGGRRRARELLNTLARETGGHAVFPKNPSEFDAAAHALNARLQMPRYTLGYASPVAASNKPRKIKVNLADNARNAERTQRLRIDFRLRGTTTAEANTPTMK